MQILDFEIVQDEHNRVGGLVVAKIQVQTGFLWWKRTYKTTVVKQAGSGTWLFKDTLQEVPFFTFFDLQNLENAWRVRESLNNLEGKK